MDSKHFDRMSVIQQLVAAIVPDSDSEDSDGVDDDKVVLGDVTEEPPLAHGSQDAMPREEPVSGGSDADTVGEPSPSCSNAHQPDVGDGVVDVDDDSSSISDSDEYWSDEGGSDTEEAEYWYPASEKVCSSSPCDLHAEQSTVSDNDGYDSDEDKNAEGEAEREPDRAVRMSVPPIDSDSDEDVFPPMPTSEDSEEPSFLDVVRAERDAAAADMVRRARELCTEDNYVYAPNLQYPPLLMVDESPEPTGDGSSSSAPSKPARKWTVQCAAHGRLTEMNPPVETCRTCLQVIKLLRRRRELMEAAGKTLPEWEEQKESLEQQVKVDEEMGDRGRRGLSKAARARRIRARHHAYVCHLQARETVEEAARVAAAAAAATEIRHNGLGMSTSPLTVTGHRKPSQVYAEARRRNREELLPTNNRNRKVMKREATALLTMIHEAVESGQTVDATMLPLPQPFYAARRAGIRCDRAVGGHCTCCTGPVQATEEPAGQEEPAGEEDEQEEGARAGPSRPRRKKNKNKGKGKGHKRGRK